MGNERMARMSQEAGAHYTTALESEPNVGMVAQQCLRQVEKKSSFVPTDPNFSNQWYLLNTGQFNDTLVGRDHKVQRAWLQGVTGCNVTAVVVDDGVEYSHLDLMPNYDYSLGYNYVAGTNDAFPFYSDIAIPIRESHGTAVAGIIAAAKDNNICGAGGAYYATLTGVNALGTLEGVVVDSDIVEGGALSHNNHLVDIYSNSWGPVDTGFFAQGPGTLAKMALEMGVKEGRDGKGIIFTFAAGNGGEEDDSCAADGYTNSIYTISVGVMEVTGYAASYDEVCSAKLVSGYVENFEDSLPKVATTGVFGQCNDAFDGTSAATPIISAIVALTLEANPNLTWRDVQYLFVYTSVSDHLVSLKDEWRTNGAGLRYSHEFGFGVANAEAMVSRARHWINVPEQEMDTIQPLQASGEFSLSNSKNVTFSYDGDIAFVEHVVITATLNLTSDLYSEDEIREIVEMAVETFVDEDSLEGFANLSLPRRGDIQIELLSPSGTKSILLPHRDLDFVPFDSLQTILSTVGLPPDLLPTDGYIEWPFMSVHFWGEDPRGEWTLSFHYRGQNNSATFEGLNIKLYGTLKIPEAVADYSDCNSTCIGGCARGGISQFCHSCINLRHAETLECIDECPSGFQELNGYCYDPNHPEPECEKVIEAPPKGSCKTAGYASCCVSGDCAGSVRSCSCDEDCYIIGDCCEDIADTCTYQGLTIPFFNLENATDGVEESGSLPSGDTVYSVIVTIPGFPYGDSYYFYIHVQEDGVFSLEEPFVNPNELGELILPFGDDADTTDSGNVTYVVVSGGPLLSQLSTFIRAKQGVYFDGNWALIAEWKDMPEYVFYPDPPKPERNTFQAALVTDGYQSYAVFMYHCGLLQWRTEDLAVGFVSQNFSSTKGHRSINLMNATDALACANLPNEWNTLVYALTETEDAVVCSVSAFAHTAILVCLDPPIGVVNITCLGPRQDSPPINCSSYPVFISTDSFPVGENTIQVIGYIADTREEVFLGKAFIVIPEIDLHFTNNTPRVEVGIIYAEFETNRDDLDIECHVKGLDKADCSSGIYSLPVPTPGDKILRVVARDRVRKERQVIRTILPVPEDDQFCHTYLINRQWRVEGNTFTLEFTSTGIASGFTCALDRQEIKSCSSPLVLSNLDPGQHHVRVVPQGCGRNYTVWNQNFVIN